MTTQIKTTTVVVPAPTAALTNALTKSMSQIHIGSIFRAWDGRTSRGLDYIVIAIDTVNKKIYCIKANSINEDGSINKNVKRYNRVFTYQTSTPQVQILTGITAIQGQKTKLNIAAIEAFNASASKLLGPAIVANTIGFKTVNLYANVNIDRRSASLYI